MKKIILVITMIIISHFGYTQGINFQGVARSANGTILASSNISLKLSIISKIVDGTPEYVETKLVLTNSQGIFSIVVGDSANAKLLGSFKNIVWSEGPKFLKVEMDPAGGTNYINMGATQLQYVPYSFYSYGVDAGNVKGIIPIKAGGTGVASIEDLKTALNLDKINNTADLSKPVSALTKTALDLKLNAVDTIKYTKQTYTDSALLTKLSITGNAATATSATTATTAGTATSATKLATARNINGVAFDGSGDITITSTADAGTLTGTSLKSTITGSSLTSVGTLANLTVTNPIVGSITGNAATATSATAAITAGNITATTNTTLISLSNLATVGTITSGVWSGTAVAISKGGTGLTAAGTNGQVLTSTGSGTLTWTTPATSSSNNSNELTGIIILGKNISGVNEVWKSNFDGSSQSKINIAGLPANYEIPSDSYRISADGQTIFFLLYTPAGGQHIYKCNIDGSGLSKIINDVDEIASVSGFYSPNTTHYVGESFGGGIIFHLYKGSDGLEHGLIVALTEQASTKWQNTGALVNATRTEDGVFNTALMTGSPAANYITSLGAGWYLPSIDELGLLYYNRYNVQKALRAGSYTLLSNTAIYWSSTEYDATNAYGFIFGGGSGGGFNNGEDKTNPFTVRGVKAF